MQPDEVVPDENDFSVIYSEVRRRYNLILGPISFVNAACKPNAEWFRIDNTMQCRAIKSIAAGEELTFYYCPHFFGDFNVECLGKFGEHRDPGAEKNKTPSRKPKKTSTFVELQATSTPLSVQRLYIPLRDLIDDCYRFSSAVCTPQSTPGSGVTPQLLNYHDVFGSIRRKRRIDLVLSLDGVPLYKASNVSIWPAWCQIKNVPPKLRFSFKNQALIGLWHGPAKPNWPVLLDQVTFELERFLNQSVQDETLGNFNFVLRIFI